jgi:hypothetical protein
VSVFVFVFLFDFIPVNIARIISIPIFLIYFTLDLLTLKYFITWIIIELNFKRQSQADEEK